MKFSRLEVDVRAFLEKKWYWQQLFVYSMYLDDQMLFLPKGFVETSNVLTPITHHTITIVMHHTSHIASGLHRPIKRYSNFFTDFLSDLQLTCHTWRKSRGIALHSYVLLSFSLALRSKHNGVCWNDPLLSSILPHPINSFHETSSCACPPSALMHHEQYLEESIIHPLNIIESCNHAYCLFRHIQTLHTRRKKVLSKGGQIDDVTVCGCMSQPKFDPEAPCLFLKQSPCWLPEELVLEADSVQREKKESLAAVSVPRWSNCVIGAWSIESKLMNSAYFTMMIINPIVAVYILTLYR